MKAFHQVRPRSLRILAVLLGVAFLAGSPSPEAQSLLGSRASLFKQNEEAEEHEFSYLQTASDVRDFADRGLLVRVPGNSDYRVADVSFPYARPEVKTFLDRLAGQYRKACRERLVVTSLTRPADRQPWNASPLSVHPTGMAADLRRSNRRACREWIERNLLVLERNNVIEATKERHPPHYHVSVFPKPYLQYLASRGDGPDVKTAANRRTAKTAKAAPARQIRIAKAAPKSSHHHSRIAKTKSSAHKKVRVGRGETLWSIAQRHGVSVAAVKRANRIRSNQLRAGQMLAIPAR